MILQPMLAAQAPDDLDKLPYPMIATPKLDGIRCLTIPMGMRVRAVTRSFKPIPNTYIRKSIETLQLYGLDGEITILGAKSFNEVSSAVMSETGEPAFKYWVFDRVHQDPQEPYYRRLQELKYLVSGLSFIAYTPTCLVRNTRELEEIELEHLSSGYEGVILRTPDSPYKFGRSTQKQAWMLKLKRFLTSEAVIIDFEEEMKNANEAKQDAFGYVERSSSLEGLVRTGRLGALVVRDLRTGVEFKIGTGFDHALRESIWDSQCDYFGKTVTYKHQPHGASDRPRFPVFLGFRDPRDL